MIANSNDMMFWGGDYSELAGLLVLNLVFQNNVFLDTRPVLSLSLTLNSTPCTMPTWKQNVDFSEIVLTKT